jgi:hypothetical protein
MHTVYTNKYIVLANLTNLPYLQQLFQARQPPLHTPVGRRGWAALWRAAVRQPD